MTRKDYALVAACIKASLFYDTSDFVYTTLYSLVCKLATEFKKANPRFDAVKFGNACGFTDKR